jgi:hypothetical protein
MDETKEYGALTIRSWRGIDSAILVLLLTVGGYTVAFTYQAGYLAYFGVPSYFAEVSARELLLCAGALAGLLFLAYNGFIAFAAVWPASVPRNAGAAIALFAFLWIQEVSFLWLYGAQLMLWVWATAIIGLLTFMMFGLPLFTCPMTPGYLAKVEASINAARKHVSQRPPKLLHRVPFQATLTVGVIYFILTTVNALGRYKARTCDVFLVEQAADPCVVLRSMSDGLLCAAFNAERHAANGIYRFLKPEGAELRLEQVGPLSAPEPYNPPPIAKSPQ